LSNYLWIDMNSGIGIFSEVNLQYIVDCLVCYAWNNNEKPITYSYPAFIHLLSLPQEVSQMLSSSEIWKMKDVRTSLIFYSVIGTIKKLRNVCICISIDDPWGEIWKAAYEKLFLCYIFISLKFSVGTIYWF
jgi:hypothetical protein